MPKTKKRGGVRSVANGVRAKKDSKYRAGGGVCSLYRTVCKKKKRSSWSRVGVLK